MLAILGSMLLVLVTEANTVVVDPYCIRQAEFVSGSASIASPSILRSDQQSDIVRVKNGEISYAFLPHVFDVESDLPSSRLHQEKKFGLSEYVLFEIRDLLEAALLGYTTEYKGCMFHHLIPSPTRAYTQSSLGSTEFRPHSDNAFLPDGISPSFLVLIGLRSPQQALTYIYPVDEVVALLDDETISTLSSPLFNISCPDTFLFEPTEYEHLLHSPLVPLLYPCVHLPNKKCMRSEKVFPTTNEAVQAMEKLDKVFPQVRRAVKFDAGDVLLFDNHRILHGRSDFKPTFDANDRWVERAYLSPLKLLNQLGFELGENKHYIFKTEEYLPYLSKEYYSGQPLMVCNSSVGENAGECAASV